MLKTKAADDGACPLEWDIQSSDLLGETSYRIPRFVQSAQILHFSLDVHLTFVTSSLANVPDELSQHPCEAR